MSNNPRCHAWGRKIRHGNGREERGKQGDIGRQSKDTEINIEGKARIKKANQWKDRREKTKQKKKTKAREGNRRQGAVRMEEKEGNVE